MISAFLVVINFGERLNQSYMVNFSRYPQKILNTKVNPGETKDAQIVVLSSRNVIDVFVS